MLQYDNIKFDYDPFPIGIANPALEPNFYNELLDNWPSIDLFEFKPEKGGKYSLSQVNNPSKYKEFIASSKPWQKFHNYIKSSEFIDDALSMLKDHNLDLGILRDIGIGEKLYLKARALKRGNPVPHFPSLKARFEFSAMPIAGGNILPHTDNQKKIVTMVVPMLADGEWDSSWGGGTAMVRPKDKTKLFNRVNDYLRFDEVEPFKTFKFEPNQNLVFIKTNNSWHAVWPMTGDDPKVLRRTLTINIESS